MNILAIGFHDRYRAPMAAAVLNLSEHLVARSCGFTEIYPGWKIAKKAVDYMLQKHAIDLNLPEEARAKRITPKMVDWADAYLICAGGCRKRFALAYPGHETATMYLADWPDPPIGDIADLSFYNRGSEDFLKHADAVANGAKRVRAHLEAHVLRQRRGR